MAAGTAGTRTPLRTRIVDTADSFILPSSRSITGLQMSIFRLQARGCPARVYFPDGVEHSLLATSNHDHLTCNRSARDCTQLPSL